MNSYSFGRTNLAAIATALSLRQGVRKFCPTSIAADSYSPTRQRKGGQEVTKFNEASLDAYLNLASAIEEAKALRSQLQTTTSTTFRQKFSEDLKEVERKIAHNRETALRNGCPEEQLDALAATL